MRCIGVSQFYPVSKMMSNVKSASQKDYLKQYLRKTKKKKTKSVNLRGANVKLIDDDIEVYKSKHEEFFIEDDEDAPVIAAVIDERPTEVKLMERYRNSSQWKQIEESETNDRRSLRSAEESPRRKRTSSSKSKQRAGNDLPSSLDSGTERRSKHYRNEVSPVRDRDKHHRENAPTSRDIRNDRHDKHSSDLPLRESRKHEDRFRDEPSASRNSHSDRRNRYDDKTSPGRDSRFAKRDKRFRDLTPVQDVCAEKRDKYYRNEFSPNCEPRFDKRYRDEGSAQRDIHSDRGRRYRDEFSPNPLVQTVGRERHFRDGSSTLGDPFMHKHDKRHRDEVSPGRNTRSDRRSRHAEDLSTRDLRFTLGNRIREDASLEQHSYLEKQDKRNREELSPRRRRDRESSLHEDPKAEKSHKTKSNKFTVKRKRASRSEEKMVNEEHSRGNGSLGYRERKIDEKRNSRGTRAEKTKKPRYEEENKDQFYDNRARGSRHIEEVREKTPIELRELRYAVDDLDRRLSPRGGRNRFPNDSESYDKRLSPRRERDRYHNIENFDRRQSPKRPRERFDDEFEKKQSAVRGRERHENNFDKRMSPRRERERFTDGRNVERRFSPRRSRDRFPSDDFDRRLSPGRSGDRFVDDDFLKGLSPRRGNARHVNNDGSDYDRRMSPRRGHDLLSRDENFGKKEFAKKGRDRHFDDGDPERNSSSKRTRDRVDDSRSLSPKGSRNGRDRHHDGQEKRRSPGKNRHRYDNNNEKRASPKRTSDREILYQESSKAEKNSCTTKSEKYGLLDSKKNRPKSEEKILDELSGRNASTIYRDRKTGKKRDFEAEKLEKIEKRRREEEKKAQYYEWGHGMKQVQEEKEKIKSDLHEMSKPLARYADDVDLDRHLRGKEKVGEDPMLGYLHKKRRKKEEREGKVTKPRYKGSYPPNRFGIPPGHRWDGVDRSNGFENKWFSKQSDKKAREEEAYKWSSADM